MSNSNVVRFQSSQSALEDSEKSLFHADRSMLSMNDSDLDKQLRSDIKTMGSMLGK
jgi:hypothetical protein